MTVREKAISWIEERAYYLWLESGCVHGKDREHYDKAERAWRKLQSKSWRSWNQDAQTNLMILLTSDTRDVWKKIKHLIRFFFAMRGEPVSRITYGSNYLTVWLKKGQDGSGYAHDWRRCELPADWKSPVAEPRELFLRFQRYTV